MATCKQCSAVFEITDDDLAFYTRVSPAFHGKRYDIPPPEQCPACRRQQRLSFRNFFNLYHRECDLTGKKIISMYRKDTPFPVYEMHAWWGDQWDPLTYGLAFDPKRPILDHITTLHRTVPRMSVMNNQSENCDYCNLSSGSRNCYLVCGNVRNEDCAYGHIIWQSENCFDCLYIYRCRYCYECIDCVQSHALLFSRDCDNCSDSMFLVHCVGCRDCFGCVGLQNRQYCIFNEQHTREEYERKIAMLNAGNIRTIDMARERVRQLTGKEIVKYYHGFNCERVTGDYLYNSRDIVEGYDLKNSENCSFCATGDTFKDCYDCNFSGTPTELSYGCFTVDGYHNLFCHTGLNVCAETMYCDNCFSCKNCFACVGLKSHKYCIFNKQYTQEEYERLVPQLIERMQREGSWGSFFPVTLSPFGYNETIAQEYFPLTKEQALERGLLWYEEEDEQRPENYLGPVVDVPDDIKNVSDEITGKILRCETSGKLFKIIPQELTFYRQLKIPLPRKCFRERQRERFAMRNPRKLFDRNCAKCQKAVQTTYAPDRPETVYCEECYLKSVY